MRFYERYPTDPEAALLILFADVQNYWRQANDRHFLDSPEACTQVSVMRDHGDEEPMVAELALGWLKTGNPHFIDLAICRVSEAGRNRGDALDALVVEVAEKRIKAATTAGGPFRIQKAIIKEIAFTLIAVLQLAAKVSLEEAASKAAQWIAEFSPNIHYKASSLWNDYPKEWKKKSREIWDFETGKISKEGILAEVVFEWYGPDSDVFYERWTRMCEAMPFANDDLTGFRH